jgi:hypothetical protein
VTGYCERGVETSNSMKRVQLEGHMAVGTRIAAFCVVAPSSLAEVYRRFRGPCWIHLIALMLEAARNSETLHIFTSTQSAITQRTVMYVWNFLAVWQISICKERVYSVELIKYSNRYVRICYGELNYAILEQHTHVQLLTVSRIMSWN